jgi:hypothetical protein
MIFALSTCCHPMRLPKYAMPSDSILILPILFDAILLSGVWRRFGFRLNVLASLPRKVPSASCSACVQTTIHTPRAD